MRKKGNRIQSIFGVVVIMILMLTAGITTKAANSGIIYTTPDEWTSDTYGTRNSAVSPRAIQLKHQNNKADNGKMLITWEYGIIENENNGKVFPIYESSDRGETWTSVGNIVETQNQSEENAGNRWGMECCPQLFELPSDVGEMKKGGIICIGCVCPKDLSATHFDMYYSEDKGRNWNYMSSLVTDGGRNFMGDDPVWESFILYDDVTESLICYYSDERYPQWNQKLVYQVTTDGINWEEAVDVVAWTDSGMRPGMPIVTQMENGYYVMVYEAVGLNHNNPIPCNYKISLYPNDPFHWDASDVGVTYGYGGSPYCLTLNDGHVAMTASGESGVFINTRKDLSGRWIVYPTEVATGYNRQLLQLDDESLFILSCGVPDQGHKNEITWGKVDVKSLLISEDSKQITNKATGKYMCIWSTSTDENAGVVEWKDAITMDVNWIPEIVDKKNNLVKFINVNSKKVLTVSDDKIVQANYESDNQGQLWKITTEEDGYSTISSVGTGKVLTSNGNLENSGFENDVAVLLSEDNGTDLQKWMLIEDTNSYDIINQLDGAAELFPSTGKIKAGADQYFIVNPVRGNTVNTIYVNGTEVSMQGTWFKINNVRQDLTITADFESVPQNARMISNKYSGKYLCLPQNSTEEGSKVLEWDLENIANFYWIPEQVEGTENVWILRNLNSQKVMSIKENAISENAEIIQTEDSANLFSQWNIQEVEKGYYSIINVGSGLALTRETTENNDHYAIQTVFTGEDSQLWKMEYVRK